MTSLFLCTFVAVRRGSRPFCGVVLSEIEGVAGLVLGRSYCFLGLAHEI